MRTYGTAKLVDGFWHIEAEAHVALRLKRVFGRISNGSVGTLKLRATDEVSRDLEWFCQRFPLEFERREQLEQRAERHKSDADTFERVLSGAVDARHFALAIPPRVYQRVAADLWLRKKQLLLADDMGVGKTVSAICGLSDPATRPALVVTLTHLPKQWEREIKRFCPALKVHVIKKGTPYDVRIGAKSTGRAQQELLEPEFPDVLVINYHKLAGWADSLAGVVRSVVLDECQEVRTVPSSGISAKRAAAELLCEKTPMVLGMSGTPIYGYGIEFWNVISIVCPDALGTRDEFITEWCSSDQIKDPKAFGSYLRESGVMLRRTRSDVNRELPPFTRSTHYCEADPKKLQDVESAAAELARVILGDGSTFHERGQATRDLDWKLRQATGVAKALFVATFVRMLVESGEKVLLYGWHRQVYELWLDALKDLRPVMFTGSESSKQKEDAFNAFSTGGAKVLIMSLRAGAGLDGLQHCCRTIVFGELDWAYGVHEQAECRVSRDGQKEPVVAYYLVSDSGSDPFVSEVIGVKRGQLEPVRDPKAELAEKLGSHASDGIKRIAEHYLQRSAGKSAAAVQPTAEVA